MDCYIYYRASITQQQQVREQVHIMQARLNALTGVGGECKRRPEATNELHTWMEVYRDIPQESLQDFEAQLSALLQQSTLPELIRGERHSEYFMDIPCA